MNDKIRALMDFLDASRSVYHTVAYISEILDQAGYTHLPEGDDWTLEDGGKYYITTCGWRRKPNVNKGAVSIAPLDWA